MMSCHTYGRFDLKISAERTALLAPQVSLSNWCCRQHSVEWIYSTSIGMSSLLLSYIPKYGRFIPNSSELIANCRLRTFWAPLLSSSFLSRTEIILFFSFFDNDSTRCLPTTRLITVCHHVTTAIPAARRLPIPTAVAVGQITT